VGEAIRALLPELARLRLAVFREYPYLYEGTPEYEQHYLASYFHAASCLVIARAGERVVGASTATPLLSHHDEVASPLLRAGFDPALVYYFGESVLLPEFRGRGIGHDFFDHREAAAREHGFSLTAFCAVERPQPDPRRPQHYLGHERFWTKRGYQRRPELVARLAWRDLGDRFETEKPMVFWIKELDR
jgi:GNAT superfamily N-acetyltransferase